MVTAAITRSKSHGHAALAVQQQVVTLGLGTGTLVSAYPHGAFVCTAVFSLCAAFGWIGVVLLMPSTTPLSPSQGAKQGTAMRAWMKSTMPTLIQENLPGWEPYISEEQEIHRREQRAPSL